MHAWVIYMNVTPTTWKVSMNVGITSKLKPIGSNRCEDEHVTW